MLRRRAVLPLLLLVLLLGASGLIVASNMGLLQRTNFAVAGVDYWLALPYRTDLTTAQDVCDAIGPSASLVSYYDTDTETRLDWTCPGGANFSVQPGRGLFVQVSSPTVTTFLGSHDTDLLVPPGGFVHTGRNYYVAIPYHTTAVLADDLCDEIPGAGLIERFDSASGFTETWTCPFGNNFALQAGEALRVVVTSSSGGFIPQHY